MLPAEGARAVKTEAEHKTRHTEADERGDLLRLEMALSQREGNAPVRLKAGDREVDVPDCVADLLLQYASLARQGLGAVLVPQERTLTTQEAADILNVSRPWVVRLVDSGDIPHTRVGNRRRIALGDVLAYKRARDARRREALREAVRLDYEMGLYALEAESE
jgi:excisionase family DNA binding protein